MKSRSYLFSVILGLIVFMSWSADIHAQPLMNRLMTPVYITSSVLFGYDSNVLRLSEHEMENAFEDVSILGDMNTFDSGIVRSELEVEYSPALISGHETRFTFDANYSYYSESLEKTYSSFSAKLETHLGRYSWFKAGYSIQPDIYLRTFVDKDQIGQDRISCIFANETVWSSLSFPVLKKTWVTGKAIQNRQYFNEFFTEFDMEKIKAEGRLTTARFNPFRMSLFYGIGEAVNSTYRSGLISTAFDRSYHEQSFGGNLKFHAEKWINSITGYITVNQRFYLSEDADDPLHTGREQEEIFYRLSVKKDLPKKFVIECVGHYRVRQTFSEFDWVEKLKSYSKFDLEIILSSNTILDLFY